MEPWKAERTLPILVRSLLACLDCTGTLSAIEVRCIDALHLLESGCLLREGWNPAKGFKVAS